MGYILTRGGQDFFVEERVLNLSEATNQEITLEKSPKDPVLVLLDLPHGTTQRYDFDYSVSGQVLTWAGFALETLLEEGDILRIVYPI